MEIYHSNLRGGRQFGSCLFSGWLFMGCTSFCTNDPYSVNQQGDDIGEKYRTGIYSEDSTHLQSATEWLTNRADYAEIAVEVQLLSNYVKSAEIHQHHLAKYPNDYCHIPQTLMLKYK